MKMVRWLLTLSLIQLLLFAGASAETHQGSVSLTPMIGGYVFEGNQDVKDDTVFGFGLGYALSEHWTAEAVFNYVEAETEVTRDDVDISLYHLDFLYHLKPFYRFEPFLAAGLGAIDVDSDIGDSDTDFMVNYGVGLKYFLTDSLALRGDVRHIVAFTDDVDNNLAYTIGISYLFGNKAKAAPAPPPAPEPTPAPTPAAPMDSDGDGVTDDVDQCPDTPAGAPVDDKGCPLDSDGDGVADYKDACPNTPKGAVVDARGCWVIEGPFFEFDKTTIIPPSHPGLNAVADVLSKNPDMKLQIEGHTDNIGSAAYNQTLSERRAQAVVDYLIKKGFDKDRFTITGYGFTRPAASNDTEEGRAKNRRVELKPIN